MTDEQVLVAIGGMNQDVSVKVPPPASGGISPFAQGDVRYGLNFRMGDTISENLGSGENIPSTLAVTDYYVWNGSSWDLSSAPAGTSKVRGRFEDKDEGSIYSSVYNSSGNHQILKFVKSERKIYEILKWSGLNFGEANVIAMCKIGDNLILTCRDNGLNGSPNPPRMMNATTITALKYTLGGSFSEYHISLAKWPPLAPPVPYYTYNGGATSEYLKKGLFQFAYRYIFYGGFRTVWSPPSWWVSAQFNPVNISVFYMRVPGFTFDYETPASTGYDNSDSRFYHAVEFIEFGYRESSLDPWKLFKRLSVDDSPVSEIALAFTNNGPSAIISQQDIGQYSDFVPFFSSAAEAIDNRIDLGDNVDDLEEPEMAITNVEVYSIDANLDHWLSPGSAFSSLSAPEQTILETITQVRKYSFKEGGIYKLGIIFQHFAGRTGLVKTLDEWTYIIPRSTVADSGGSEQLHALGFKIDPSIDPPETAVAYQIVRSTCLNIEFFIEGFINNFKFLNWVSNGVDDAEQMPTAIQTILNDFYNSTGPTDLLPLSNRITAAIRKSTVSIFPADAATCAFIYMDIANFVLGFPAQYGGAGNNPPNNLFYNFQKGDRVVFFGSTTTTTPAVAADYSTFDEEIVAFTGQGIIVKRPATLIGLVPRASAQFLPNAFKIEIYRPRKFNQDETVIFNEMGEWYPITQPGTVSRDFSKRDFTWTDCAAVTVDSVINNRIYQKMPITIGDVHIVLKNFYFDPSGGNYPFGNTGELYFAQMNQDKDDAGGRWEHNNGRPLISYQYAPQNLTKTGQVRFSGKFLEDSVFIDINRFRGQDQYIYPSEYGRIRALCNTSNAQVESVGNILLVICEQEALSVYVNRTTIEDLSGSTQVSLSNKVLGSYNTLLGSQGTLNPESVSRESGKVLWWNAKRGVWVRYSRDGLTEISKEGMKTWFKDLSKLLVNTYSTSTPARVISTFDDFHDEWLTYIQHADLPSTFRGYDVYKCAPFAEREADKKWKPIMSYAADLFAALDNEVYSLIGSAVHIHEAGADYGSFYGTKQDTMVEPVANKDVRKNKIWQQFVLDASDGWSFERILGDWRSNGATQQNSRLNLGDLEKKEDTYWAGIKNDKNTPNAASEQAAVISGERMRSKTLRILMKLDPSVTWLSLWNYLTVEYDFSDPNPKK